MRCFGLLIAALLSAALLCGAAASGAGTPPAQTLGNKLGMEFVLIPAGSFMMGSPPSEPNRHPNERQVRVTITKPFYMQTTEVTCGQWRKLMGRSWFSWRRKKANIPKTRISWYQAMDFIEKLNQKGWGRYRLPTEAEWEYAARAGSKGPFPWGKKIDCSKAMYANNSLKENNCASYYARRGLPNDGPAPVKSFPPNAWGLYDMQGNVWEWVSDWYWPDYPKGPLKDPIGPEEGNYKVRRGGSWFRGGWSLRSAKRNFAHPASLYDTLGFRVVREVD